MTAPDYWRQLDVVDPAKLNFRITVIGAGGIGSPTVLALAKMGCPDLVVYDPDSVEQHNLPNQLYRLADVGQLKATALQSVIRDFTGTDLVPIEERFTGGALSGVVISAVDTMRARQVIWSEVRYRAAVALYIDARMGAEVCRIFSVRPTDPDLVRFYESTLYDDEAATKEACTAQAVVYNVFGVAAFITHQVKRYASGEENQREVLCDFATLSLLTD